MEDRQGFDEILSGFYLIHFRFVQSELARYCWLYADTDPEIMRDELLADLRKSGQEQFFAEQIRQMKMHPWELRGVQNTCNKLYQINLAEYIAGSRDRFIFFTAE